MPRASKAKSPKKDGFLSFDASSPVPAKWKRLTRKNYFSAGRPYLSNSQISDYLLSPSYFYKRHIECSIPDASPTPSMVRGMAVDAIVTGGKLPEKLSQKQADEATQIANAVTGTPFFFERVRLTDSIFWQPPLRGVLDGLQICGMPDMVIGSTEIIDLKVVSALKVSSPSKWMMNAIDMGYIRQMAMYAYLLRGFAGFQEMKCYHLVAAPVKDGVVRVKAYRIPSESLMDGLTEIRLALKQIRENKYDDPVLDDRAVEDLPYYRRGGGADSTSPLGDVESGEDGP